MVRYVTTIDLSGPFFTYDPTKRLARNIEAMMAAVAEEGETDVAAQAAAHQKTGRFYEGVVGRVSSLAGKPWHKTAVISQTAVYPWPNGGPKQYRGGKLEAKYGFFRKTKSRLNRSRAVNRAELTKGMN